MGFVVFALGYLVGLHRLERSRPLRRATEPGAARLVRNVALSVLTAAVASLVDRPVTSRLARRADARGVGLLKRLRLPGPIETVAAVLVLDYALYLWHVALHRVDWLWRSHVVHHSDRDLDTSTALRFHFTEIAASTVWRAVLVRLAGIGAGPLALHQRLLFLSVLFHHSNVRLPLAVERALVALVVTPRMHGIHHSTVRDETDSNWSSLLTVWDALHGTLRLDVPQGAVEIGVPGFPQPLGVVDLTMLPFVAQPPSWPGDRAGRTLSTAGALLPPDATPTET